MLPDIELEECIAMLETWMHEAMAMKRERNDFEYVLIAHKYRQIKKHLQAYKKLKEEAERPLHERLTRILREVRGEL